MKTDRDDKNEAARRWPPIYERVPARFRRPARIATGFLLLIGGVLGFLPIVGFWMIPLGLSILAVDIPVAGRVLDRLRALGRRLMRLFNSEHRE